MFGVCGRCASWYRLADSQGAGPEWTGESQRLADAQGVDYDPPGESRRPFDPQGYDPEPRHQFVLCLGREMVWVNEVGDDVDRFLQDLDEGLVAGIPPTTNDPEDLTHYAAEWSDIMLRTGHKFSELGVPEGDTLNLYVVLIHPDSIVARRRGRVAGG